MTPLIRNAIEAIFRQRAAFLAMACGALLLAGAASLLVAPVWRATAVVAFPKTMSESSGIGLLADRELDRQVVNRLGPAALYPGLSPGRAAEAFAGDLAAVEQTPDSYQVTYDGRDPAIALRALETTFQVFGEQHAQALAALAGAAFDQQAATFTAMLDEAKGRLAAYQQTPGGPNADEERRQLLRQRADWNKEMDRLTASQNDLAMQLQALKSQMADTPATIPETDQSNRYKMIDDAKARLLELQLKEQELLAKYKETSQFVITVREEMARVRSYLNDMSASITQRARPSVNDSYVEMSRNLIKAQSQMTGMETRRSVLAGQLAEADRRLAELNAGFQQRQALQQAVAEAERNLSRLDEARRQTVDASQANPLLFIEPPRVSARPLQPDPLLYFGLALPVGLLTGLGLALLAQAFAGTFGAPKDVERRLGLPVLAALPSQS